MQSLTSSHVFHFLEEAQQICSQLDVAAIEELVTQLRGLREEGGRLFILGVGGSAATGSHAVNDFRKLCGIETYTPVDNVSELTARTNDEGWDTVFSEWLRLSKINSKDAVLVLSVGGGNVEKNISPNIIRALDVAKEKEAKIFGIVGRKTGYTQKVGNVVIVVPECSSEHVTPHSEAFQSVILHCLVSHPKLQINKTKW